MFVAQLQASVEDLAQRISRSFKLPLHSLTYLNQPVALSRHGSSRCGREA